MSCACVRARSDRIGGAQAGSQARPAAVVVPPEPNKYSRTSLSPPTHLPTYLLAYQVRRACVHEPVHPPSGQGWLVYCILAQAIPFPAESTHLHTRPTRTHTHTHTHAPQDGAPHFFAPSRDCTVEVGARFLPAPAAPAPPARRAGGEAVGRAPNRWATPAPLALALLTRPSPVTGPRRSCSVLPRRSCTDGRRLPSAGALVRSRRPGRVAGVEVFGVLGWRGGCTGARDPVGLERDRAAAAAAGARTSPSSSSMGMGCRAAWVAEDPGREDACPPDPG
jgi:hypothetical protein